MSQKLKIDFVSDVACPWCAIGLSSLERALEQLGDEVDAQIVMHPFELNPQMDAQGQDTVEYLSKKYGRTAEQIEETQAMIRERGATVGFDFGPRNRVYNTFDAHRLLHWAGLEGKQLELKLALLRAYHSDGKDVSNHDVLAETAQSVGLDADKARAILQGTDYAADVRAEEEQAHAMGIQSVPSIIFNDQYLVTGGLPVESFENAIRQILANPEA